MKSIIIFDGSTHDYLMRNGKFACGFNTPLALSGESTHGLPPYCKRMPYLVDKYPACPKDWMRSEGIIKSFFVPVIKDRGMWLDFNENSTHTHHVAIVISVQGVNPITGLPCKDAQLEQYIEKCPKHNIKFGPDRYCKKCDYKWPKQNYITTTATPHGMFWLDGFRTVEGVVRQYILTAEKMRGVASNIIGKDRVYAIGLSFFVSKEKKPKQVDYSVLRVGGPQFFSPVHTPVNWNCLSLDYSPSDPKNDNLIMHDYITDTTSLDDIIDTSSTGGITSTSALAKSSTSTPPAGALYKKALASSIAQPIRCKGANIRSIQTTKLEVGAGAKINQSVCDDPEKLEYWHDKPEAIICVNYATEKEVQKIVEAGEIDIEGHKEGFLKEVPVGN
jgi:hypothetical protein